MVLVSYREPGVPGGLLPAFTHLGGFRGPEELLGSAHSSKLLPVLNGTRMRAILSYAGSSLHLLCSYLCSSC